MNAPNGSLPVAEVNARQGFVLAGEARERMEYDVVIVGAGPAGLATAIRVRQLARAHDRDVAVCVLEKGVEAGAHILSGAVIDPGGLAELMPDWEERGAPLTTRVSADRFLWLGPAGGVRIPHFALPPPLRNRGCRTGSLGDLCRWLAQCAEEEGVEIFPGFAAAEVLLDDAGAVAGVVTGDMGLSKAGGKKSTYAAGVEIRGRYTIFAEGARGSLSRFVIRHFGLDKGREAQKYGIGVKELWEVAPECHRPGFVQHTIGWPLPRDAGGGSFLYHYGRNLVAVGLIVHLNYKNPHLSPFDEFQRFKTHPFVREVFAGGRRIGYGARAVTEGGWQSAPELAFPGGALVGCAAGFMDVPRIKGSHNAIRTGVMAGEAAFAAVAEGRRGDVLETYAAAYRRSRVFRDLRRSRNVKPLWSRLGLAGGVLLGGVDLWMRALRVGLPFTLGHGPPDHATLRPAAECKPVDYPKPDGVLTFDRLSSLALSGVSHGEDQPVHLTLRDPGLPVAHNLPVYDEPAQRYCPAGVYEIITDSGGLPRLQINAQNCVHCKTCDIKDPEQNINWVPPEGGGGPVYSGM